MLRELLRCAAGWPQKIVAGRVFSRGSARAGMVLIMLRFPSRRARRGPLEANPMNRSTLGNIVLTAAVAVGGITFVVRASANAERYFHVEQLMDKELPEWTDKELKIQGTVVTGSIQEKIANQETQRTFLLQSGGKRIR